MAVPVVVVPGRLGHPLGRSPRFVWTDVRPDHDTYVRIVLDSISERQRWRAQYEAAKTAVAGLTRLVDGNSTVAQPPRHVRGSSCGFFAMPTRR